MDNKWTKYDWASNKHARDIWDEDEFLAGVDRSLNERPRRTKMNKKNHRNYA